MTIKETTQNWINYLLDNGAEQLTKKEYIEKLSSIGYKLDPTMQTKGISRCLSDESLNSRYISVYPVSKENGLSWAHYQQTHNKDLLRQFREKYFYVSRGHVVDF